MSFDNPIAKVQRDLEREKSIKTGTRAGKHGLTMGVILAMILSWETSHSVLFAIGHGLLSWFYVIYWCVRHRWS